MDTICVNEDISVGEREEEEGKVVVDTQVNDPLTFPFQKASDNLKSRMDTICANDDISVGGREEEEGKVVVDTQMNDPITFPFFRRKVIILNQGGTQYVLMMIPVLEGGRRTILTT